MALEMNETSYSGTYASYFWLPATFGMDTIQKGVVYVVDGIKKKHTIDRLDVQNPLQPRQPTPSSSGVFLIDGRVLNPLDMMAYIEFNPRQFEANFLAEKLSQTLLTRELPVIAENYMMQMALNRCFEQIELGIWQGSLAWAGKYPYGTPQFQLQFFNGFMQKFLNDANVVLAASPLPLVATASVGGTSMNILDAMTNLIYSVATTKKALLSNVKRFKRLKFIMSVNSEQIYQEALTTYLEFKGLQTMEAGVKPWKGYEIVSLAGMPDDTILFCEALPDTSSNLYVGMNSTEDNKLELRPLQNNSEIWFFKGLMKFDVQYGFSEQIFLYTTQVTGDYEYPIAA